MRLSVVPTQSFLPSAHPAWLSMALVRLGVTLRKWTTFSTLPRWQILSAIWQIFSIAAFNVGRSICPRSHVSVTKWTDVLEGQLMTRSLNAHRCNFPSTGCVRITSTLFGGHTRTHATLRPPSCFKSQYSPFNLWCRTGFASASSVRLIYFSLSIAKVAETPLMLMHTERAITCGSREGKEVQIDGLIHSLQFLRNANRREHIVDLH